MIPNNLPTTTTLVEASSINQSDYGFHLKRFKQILFTKKLQSTLLRVFNSIPKPSTKVYLILLYILVCTTPALSHSGCTFPEHWWGTWFRKGVSELIHITKYNISDKGICRKNNKEKYIIENRNEKCLRCLFIHERHPNLLQYKETSVCYQDVNKLSLDICYDINGDETLFSLFRVNTSPIKCPFQGPYTFSYSKGLNECREPLSEIDECTDDKHLLLKFKACADVPGSESRVEELECFAEWKEGSYKYLVGKLNHKAATSDEDKFRCFVIEKNNTDPVESYYIGQSGDASCEGLFHPRDGLRTFKIRRSQKVEPKCNFPRWLAEKNHWKTLDNQHWYDFTSFNEFTVYNEKREKHRHSKCIESEDDFIFKNSSRSVIYTTSGCKTGYACMQAHLREDRIAEIQIGNVVPLGSISEACSLHNFSPKTTRFITLTTYDDATRPCALSGLFSIRSKVPHSRSVPLLDTRFICQDKHLKLKSNCDDQDQFQFVCTTDNRVKNFKCRGGWTHNNTQYFLVSFLEKFNYEYCIAYDMGSGEMRLVRRSHFCYRESQFSADHRPLGSASNVNNFFGHPKVFDHSFNDDLVTLQLINEGQCNQRSAATSYIYHFYLITILLNLNLVLALSS